MNARFSTYDRDYDLSCAEIYKGGWWYKKCLSCKFTGTYGLTFDRGEGMHWLAITGSNLKYAVTLAYADLKIRIK